MIDEYSYRCLCIEGKVDILEMPKSICYNASRQKKDVSAHVARKKPRRLRLRGFSIPFWVGGLIPRLTTG